MIYDLNIIDFWRLDKSYFLNRLSNTVMDDQWYNTLETFLCLSTTDKSISVECLAWLLEECLDIETHMIIAQYHPFIVRNAYNWLAIINQSKYLEPKRQAVISSVNNYLKIVK